MSRRPRFRSKTRAVISLAAVALLVAVATPVAGATESPEPINVVILDSQGTWDLELTNWEFLNEHWDSFGDTPVEIDFTSFEHFDAPAPLDFDYEDIAATGADVVVISTASQFAFEYTQEEVDAVTQYVAEGHGIIITYQSLEGTNSGLAPLVGLDEDISLETNTFEPLEFEMTQDHPIFQGVDDPYATGVNFMATPGVAPASWPVTTGEIVASVDGTTLPVVKQGAIVVNETDTYRGVYFPHYLENMSGGSNDIDAKVFYNALVWTGTTDTECTIVGTSGKDVLVGTSGADVICGRGGNDIIYGNAGDDVLRGGDGDDRIFGGAGFDMLKGNRGDDRLIGGSQGDVILGGVGDDVLRGKGGDDRLEGNRGNDTLFGAKGDDVLLGGNGIDACDGGVGANLYSSCE